MENNTKNSCLDPSSCGIDENMTNAQHVKHFRKTLGLSRDKFLKEMHLKMGQSYSTGYLQRIEDGHMPITDDFLKKMNEFKKKLKG